MISLQTVIQNDKKKNKNQKSKNTTLFFLQSGARVLCSNPNSTPGPACGAAELNPACCLPCPRPGTVAVFPKETQRKGELHGLPTDTTLPASQAQLQPEILPKEPGIGFTVSSSDHQKPRGQRGALSSLGHLLMGMKP